VHPREKRSALQSSTDLCVRQVCLHVILIGREAAKAFPSQITATQSAEVVIGFQSGRPFRADVMPYAIHWHFLL
jgi:hypothetical protein